MQSYEIMEKKCTLVLNILKCVAQTRACLLCRNSLLCKQYTYKEKNVILFALCTFACNALNVKHFVSVDNICTYLHSFALLSALVCTQA